MQNLPGSARTGPDLITTSGKRYKSSTIPRTLGSLQRRSLFAPLLSSYFLTLLAYLFLKHFSGLATCATGGPWILPDFNGSVYALWLP